MLLRLYEREQDPCQMLEVSLLNGIAAPAMSTSAEV